MEKHICNRCGNSDQRFFGIRNGEIYCRKCLMFQGEKAKNTIALPDIFVKQI